MYAIIQSGSRQYQVSPESVIEVNRLPLEEGAAFETDQVLLVDQDGNEVQVGTPFVNGVKVRGKVLEHRRGRKVVVFKFKRRKNYKRTHGHRQELTRVLIESIDVGGKTVTPAKPKPEKATAPRETAAKEGAAPPKKAAEKTSAKPVMEKAKSSGLATEIAEPVVRKATATADKPKPADKGKTTSKAKTPAKNKK